MRILLCFPGCFVCCVAIAADPSPKAAGANPPPRAADDSAESIDAQLLEGLDDELMSDLKDLDLDDAESPKGPSESRRKFEDLDRELIEQLGRGAGEDVGTQGESDPLSRIGERMREAQRLIHRADVGEPTRELQDKIVSEIETLIREARRRQSSSSSSNNSKQKTAERKQVKQPQQSEAKGSGSGDPNKQPAQDSTNRVERDRVGEVDMRDMRELMRQVWGHLPQREREQMLQSAVDVFLPKYSTMIEDYFRRLSEMP